MLKLLYMRAIKSVLLRFITSASRLSDLAIIKTIEGKQLNYNMNELISVIINVYNCEKYIKKCLDSVVNQTYKNLEIIIVNDGSTDKTLEICQSYDDERIKIITTPNQGLSLSRNTGLNNAKGEYYYFVDADDFVDLDVIEYLYNLIKKYDRKIAMCETLVIKNYNYKKKPVKEKISIKDDKEMIRQILFDVGRAGTTWNKLYHKSIFDNIRFENRIINDVVVTYKCYLEAGEIIFSNLCKYYYYRHSDSISLVRKPERQIDLYKGCLERYYYIKNIYYDFADNDVGMLRMIFFLYRENYMKISDFYRKEQIKKKYNEIFSYKVIRRCTRGRAEKLELIVFRYCPKLACSIKRIYDRYKNKRKKKVNA